jgi:nucleotide-binding universal stress UspA family protein
MKIQTILVTTDFSACAAQSYAPAAVLARRFGATIHLVRCTDYPFPYSTVPFEGANHALLSYREILQAKLEAAGRDPLFAGLELRMHLLGGGGRTLGRDGPKAVAELAGDLRADLIVQSSHGHRGWRRLLLGSFAEKILRLAPVPVLTFRGPEVGEFPPRRILFPFDHSECSRAALEALRFFASAFGSKVFVLHVWTEIPEISETAVLGPAVSEELSAVREETPGRFRKDLRRFMDANLQGIEHVGHVVQGDPATTILERARDHDVDLICMATHGWTGLTRLVLGSTTERVAHGADRALLTVRPAPKNEEAFPPAPPRRTHEARERKPR